MFNGKHVVITGGSSGLGLAVAKVMIRQGARLSIIARDMKKLELARKEILNENHTGIVNIYSADVSKMDILAGVFKKASETSGAPDVLFNSAGILREGYFETIPDGTFREVMETNFFGILNSIMVALPYIKKQKGRIINISSVAGMLGVFGYSPYCSSKFAINGLTETLRFELKPAGVRVHLVCPPEFDSPMVDELNKTRTPENRAHVQTIPPYDMDTIVRDIFRGLMKDRYLIIPGLQTRITVWANRHFPSISRFVSDRIISSTYIGPKTER
ncbi:MAG: SDR family oxidoreductase [Spirochaetes bacterium]|nr:SDR family oxidoreductase [Spirochaetota bacterium]